MKLTINDIAIESVSTWSIDTVKPMVLDQLKEIETLIENNKYHDARVALDALADRVGTFVINENGFIS
jgi:hypothetical protein